MVLRTKPTGLRHENEIKPEDSIAQHTGKNFKRWIIAMTALATNTSMLHRDASSTTNAANAKIIAADLVKVPHNPSPIPGHSTKKRS